VVVVAAAAAAAAVIHKFHVVAILFPGKWIDGPILIE